MHDPLAVSDYLRLQAVIGSADDSDVRLASRLIGRRDGIETQYSNQASNQTERKGHKVHSATRIYRCAGLCTRKTSARFVTALVEKELSVLSLMEKDGF